MDLEIALLVLVLLIALAPMSLRAFLPVRRGVSLTAGLGLVLLVVAASSRYRTERRTTPEREVRGRPTQELKAGYVTSETCRSCHPGEYSSWHDSFHRTMTQVASAATIVAPFDGIKPSRVTPHVLGQDGDSFWVDVQGERHEIVMVTGSHHMQVYWLRDETDGREVRMFEYTWRIPEQRWMPISAAFLTPPNRLQNTGGGRWNRSCYRCHTTGSQPRLDHAEGVDSVVSEFGIACEACHGAAEEHVRANQSPWRRFSLRQSGAPDPTIANPARMDPVLAADICGHCHGSLYVASNESRQIMRNEGCWFPPGTPLTDVHQIQREGEDRFWDDGMVRVAGREYNGTIRSPCHTHGDPDRGIMTCLDCHSMHRTKDDDRPVSEWTEDQLKPGIRDANQSCLQCHEDLESATRLAAHTHHEVGSTGSLCFNCHMPHTSYGLLKATRSHTISSPTVAESVDVGRPNACNLCHLDRTLGWTAAHLSEWYGTEPAATLRAGRGLTEDEETIAASVLWMLKGDAGQRALAAWAYAWEPARQASGTDWMAPVLAPLLNDDYHAVRFIGYRTLGTLAPFEGLDHDSLERKGDRPAAMQVVWESWNDWAAAYPVPPREEVLLSPRGVRLKDIWRLLHERDDKPVILAE